MARTKKNTPLQQAKLQQATLAAVSASKNKVKLKRKKPFFTATNFYPWAIEAKVTQWLEKQFKKVATYYKELALAGINDDAEQLEKAPEFSFGIEFQLELENFFNEINSFALNAQENFEVKTIGRTIGNYVPTKELKEDFVKTFVANCESASVEQKKKIAELVYKHRMFPEQGESLVEQINNVNKNFTKKQAKFIARNETENINGALMRERQTQAGFDCYQWMTMMDGAVRDSHLALNGMVCKWSNPNVYSEDGGKTWKKRKASMYIGQPCQAYNCRCTALPFDVD